MKRSAVICAVLLGSVVPVAAVSNAEIGSGEKNGYGRFPFVSENVTIGDHPTTYDATATREHLVDVIREEVAVCLDNLFVFLTCANHHPRRVVSESWHVNIVRIGNFRSPSEPYVSRGRLSGIGNEEFDFRRITSAPASLMIDSNGDVGAQLSFASPSRNLNLNSAYYEKQKSNNSDWVSHKPPKPAFTFLLDDLNISLLFISFGFVLSYLGFRRSLQWPWVGGLLYGLGCIIGVVGLIGLSNA